MLNTFTVSLAIADSEIAKAISLLSYARINLVAKKFINFFGYFVSFAVVSLLLSSSRYNKAYFLVSSSLKRIMPTTRRAFITKMLTITGYTLGLAFSKASFANWLADEFQRQPINKALTLLFPDQILHKTNKIHLKLPRIAENGSVVPITITSSIENVDTIFIFSEKNPVPLVAKFSINPELETFIGARFKMQETCDVIVVLKAEDQYYQTRQKVKVTLGGCGG
ncbi:sulfur-oxidizing protein SoxY [Bathymodiolus platifrons methanotrophic gill symbiont]|nr:thiosulfate oxidation carrier protein SoxY [Methylococcaceae bacterium CS5]TXL08798.1 thiosulfate oxidation carrier protein SoxY [Methylococcaceae bacterium CS1]TXL09045.1 thiosulfate oxidation carrier protein SoxY [Methylococcaceae bacterium CS3]TXL11048.1 thiosulfate oxidation carrier protein SoxY [Methylococcaceae bacterium CS2]TXL15079.1 thiosulfate oxidation carrier protein SoxY [Methylococcaceae bacterium HT4]TXL18606.1 thiosulfate oxidation carrier protein SoxY [Methylococcaceae bact